MSYNNNYYNNNYNSQQQQHQQQYQQQQQYYGNQQLQAPPRFQSASVSQYPMQQQEQQPYFAQKPVDAYKESLHHKVYEDANGIDEDTDNHDVTPDYDAPHTLTLTMAIFLGLYFFGLGTMTAVHPIVFEEWLILTNTTADPYPNNGGLILQGAFILFFAPLVGLWSDRTRSSFGRRRPFIIAGLILVIIPVLLAHPKFPVLLLFSPYFFGPGTAMMTVAGLGLVRDLVNRKDMRRFAMSQAFFFGLGSLVAAVLLIFFDQIPGDYAAYICQIIILGILTTTTVIFCVVGKEQSSLNSQFEPLTFVRVFTELFKPMRTAPVRRLFLSRSLMIAGIMTMVINIRFYVRDCIDSDISVTAETGWVQIPALVVTTLSVFLVPRDKRKIVVYIGSIFAIIGIVFGSFTKKFWLLLIAVLIFYLGRGPYYTVEFLMAIDVYPSAKRAGAFFGLWSIAQAIPYFTVLPIGNVMLNKIQSIGDNNNIHCLGFKTLSLWGSIMIVAAVIILATIKQIR